MGVDILIVQHGEKLRVAGDPGLTEAGHMQASVVAEWLRTAHPEVCSVWASPLERAQQTAAPIGATFDVTVRTDARLRERMNWDGDGDLDRFLAEWRRASDDRTYHPASGDSSVGAAQRFLDALVDIGHLSRQGTVIVVAHGGVTTDLLRSLVGDEATEEACPGLIERGVPSCAITRLRLDDADVSVVAFPSTSHLGEATEHPPHGRDPDTS